MNILVHLRPGEKNFYLELAKNTFPEASILTISDIRNNGDFWFGDYIYINSNTVILDENEMEDIRIRCRFLRKLPKDQAIKLIINLSYGMNLFFKKHSFNIVFSGIVDCYIQDILERFAKKYNVIYIGFVGHFFEGYSRLSIRGELINVPRSINEKEIDAVLNKVVDQEYKPNFKLNKEKNILDVSYYYSREYIKKFIYFPLRKLLEQDPLNYHYNTTIGNFNFESINKNIVSKYFSNISEIICKINENTVYMPLHYSPEATVDYWADNPQFAFQEETIIKILKEKDPNIMVILKEHPAMYLLRDISFYKEVKKLENVVIVHPYESSNYILSKVNTVAVFTGSVGVEALLRNKRVLTFSENYYSKLHPNIFKVDKLNVRDINKAISVYDNRKFIKELLSGMFLCEFYNDKRMFSSDIESMINILKYYIDDIIEKKGKHV